MRHEVIHTSSGSTMLQAAGTGLRFSVRWLETFDDPAALSCAALCRDSAAARRHLKRLQARCASAMETARKAEEAGAIEELPWQAQPLPLLILDENAFPTLLLPLLRWRNRQSENPFSPREIITLAGTGRAVAAQHILLQQAGARLTALQTRSLWHTVLRRLPHGADLLLCHPLDPATSSPTASMTRLMRQQPSLLRRALPCCPSARPLSWRGWLALLRVHLASYGPMRHFTGRRA